MKRPHPMRRFTTLLVLPAAMSCAKASFPTPPISGPTAVPGVRMVELKRHVDQVGEVLERVTSRQPSQVEDGSCAGRMEFFVPGAPGGPQEYLAEVGCPDGTSRVQAVRLDVEQHKRMVYQPTLEQFMRARGMVLAARDPGVTWYVPDLAFDGLSSTTVLHAKGHAHSKGEDAKVLARQLVLAVTRESGHPSPGTHLDDVQLAVLDADGNALLRLMLDGSSVGTHATVHTTLDQNGGLSGVGYAGLLLDAAGAWRFVDLWLPVTSSRVPAGQGISGAWNAAVASASQEFLGASLDGDHGHLWVDGTEWLAADSVAGFHESTRLRATAAVSEFSTVNLAPPQAPRVLLADAGAQSARLFQDATIVGDVFGWATMLPPKSRAGWSRASQRFSVDGVKEAQEQSPFMDRQPFTSRTVKTTLQAGKVLKVTRQLVAANVDGQVEYGLRTVVQPD